MYPRVVALGLELGDLLLALQQLLPTPVQLLGQHRKLLHGHHAGHHETLLRPLELPVLSIPARLIQGKTK